MQPYRERLLQREEELLAAIARTGSEVRQNNDVEAQDPLDKATQAYDKESLLQQQDSDRNQLLQVQEALRRMDRGEFGKCIECGRPLDPKRLEAVPWTGYCLECQERRDREML